MAAVNMTMNMTMAKPLDMLPLLPYSGATDMPPTPAGDAPLAEWQAHSRRMVQWCHRGFSGRMFTALMRLPVVLAKRGEARTFASWNQGAFDFSGVGVGGVGGVGARTTLTLRVVERDDKSYLMATRAILATLSGLPYIAAVHDMKRNVDEVAIEMAQFVEAVRYSALDAVLQDQSDSPALAAILLRMPESGNVKALSAAEKGTEPLSLADMPSKKQILVTACNYGYSRRVCEALPLPGVGQNPPVVDFDDGDTLFKREFTLDGGDDAAASATMSATMSARMPPLTDALGVLQVWQ